MENWLERIRKAKRKPILTSINLNNPWLEGVED